MNKSIVYVSVSGNTKLLAETIERSIGGCSYIGNPNDRALDSDVLYIGFWTAKFSCPPDIQDFLKKLHNKKVFLFGTAGYDNTPEFFAGILDSVAAHLDSSNEIIGRFMCQGKVSAAKKKALETADAEKYRSMQDKLIQGDQRPDERDLAALKKLL